jgi:hypothetical protein
MNTNYVKGFNIEQKYRNRTKADADNDTEWKKYREEKQNSQKMSTILRSLNGTAKKRRTLAPSASNASQMRGNASSVNVGRSNKLGTPFSGIKPLQEAEVEDEVSNI